VLDDQCRPAQFVYAEVLTRFLSNNSDEAALEQEQAEFDDIEVDADKDK